HNIEAEQALLGAILVDNEAFYRVSDFLEPRHFFEPVHQKIYEDAGSLIRVGKVANPVTLKTFLPADVDIAGLSVNQSLARLAASLTTAVDMAARAYQRDGGLSGLATGLADLDRMMGGLQPSDLVILAGRPGMGKSALATNIAYNVARAWRGEVRPDGHTQTLNGGIVGFFSLEMSAEQLATRIIAEQTGIASSTIRRGGIHEQDFEKIKDVAIELQHLPFFIDETGGLTVA